MWLDFLFKKKKKKKKGMYRVNEDGTPNLSDNSWLTNTDYNSNRTLVEVIFSLFTSNKKADSYDYTYDSGDSDE